MDLQSPDPDARRTMCTLLADCFTADEFRRFMADVDPTLPRELLGEMCTAGTLVAAGVDLLFRHGHVDRHFFARWAELRPKRRAQIFSVAGETHHVEAVEAVRGQTGDRGRERHRVRMMLANIIMGRIDVSTPLDFVVRDKFTDLETEVEADRHAPLSTLAFWRRRLRAGQLRLESRLIPAIERSQETFILLEGEPGSGKTVSLRRVQRHFAEAIKSNPDCHLPLPLYVDLKRVSSPGAPLERIRRCILGEINREPQVASPWFDQGCRHGGWLLLLDGFDEIPDVLTAIEASSEVQAYSHAIQDFCVQINLDPAKSCRAIVATRYFRGPSDACWSHFRLRPLSETRRHQFIANLGLKPNQIKALTDALHGSPVELQRWSDNPLALTMLCEVIRSGLEFPDNTHQLFESYISIRLERDEGRAVALSGVDVKSLRRDAEDVAFVISAERLGLAPSNGSIRDALERHRRANPNLERTLEAIKQLELALGEDWSDESHTCFRHRRLQEYFATCVLLREPNLLAPSDLLFNARWREASVVLLQQSPLQSLGPLFESMMKSLLECREELGIAPEPLDLALQPHDAIRWTVERLSRARVEPQRVAWPKRLYHLLDLVQAGFAYRNDLPEDIQQVCASLLFHIYEAGTRIDRKYTLELAGVLPRGFLEGFAINVFDNESWLLQDVAFRQLPRVGSGSVETWIRITKLLYRMARSGKLVSERLAAGARIRRMGNPLLEVFFDMASTSRDVVRVIRITMGASYIIIIAFLYTRSVVSLTSALILLGLATSVPLLALIPVKSAHFAAGRVNVLLDLFGMMASFFFIFIAGKLLGVPLIVAIVAVALFTYSSLWGHAALIAVWFAIPLRRSIWTWPFLPIIFACQLIGRAPKLLYSVALVVIMVVAANLFDKPDPPDWVVLCLFLPLLVVACLGFFVLGRQIWLYSRDFVVERTLRSRYLSKITTSDLKDLLGRLRTSRARIRLLNDVLLERHFSLLLVDSETRTELEKFAVAFEQHCSNVPKYRRAGLSETLLTRIPFPPSYVAGCTSESQRWCLAHCNRTEGVEEMELMIDLLTQLLERAEKNT